MSTVAGIVLGPMQIMNEYGTISLYKNNLKLGEKIWIYYDNENNIVSIESQKLIPKNRTSSIYD